MSGVHLRETRANLNERSVGSDRRDHLDAVIVGAGFAGVTMLYHLKQRGVRVEVFDSADGVGGTWYHNRYPGAHCDIESLDYSFSFSEELQQSWSWSERYGSQPEILRYINHVVDRFDLRGLIRLNTTVTSARFDDSANRWTLATGCGAAVTAKYCIMATGVLSASQVPGFPGLDSFEGRWLHTADWPREEVDLTGERVGIVGTGSSGTQLIPILAEQAEHLVVFQRTANFVMPARNHALDPEVESEWKANYQERRQIARASRFGHNQLSNDKRGSDVSAEERLAEFEKRWNLGGLYMMRAFTDILIDPAVNDHAAEFVRGKIRGIVKDPEVAEALVPRHLPLGTKRLCSGTGYYETFNRDNVQLVDVKASPIAEITPAGVRTQDAEYPLDALVLATGFDAMTGSLQRIDIRGRHGVRLRDRWQAGPRTYMGVATSGFPNLFILAGPQSPSVFSNMVLSAEQHAEWVRDCISYLEEHDIAAIEATEDSEARWVEHVNEEARGTLYEQSQNTWFWGANTPGKPRAFMPYLGGVASYVGKLEDIARNDYEGFVLR